MPLLPVNLGGKKQKRSEKVVSKDSQPSKARRVMEEQDIGIDDQDQGRVMEEDNSSNEELLKSTTEKHMEMRKKHLRGCLDQENRVERAGVIRMDDDSSSDDDEEEVEVTNSEASRDGCNEVSNHDSAVSDVTAEVSLCYIKREDVIQYGKGYAMWVYFIFANTITLTSYLNTGCKADC